MDDGADSISTVLRACREYARSLLARRLRILRSLGIPPDAAQVASAEVARLAADELPAADGGKVVAARDRFRHAVSEATLFEVPHPFSRLSPALDLPEGCVDLIGVLWALETTPVLRQVALSCVADPVVSGITPLFLAELVASTDAERRDRLADLGPQGPLQGLAIVQCSGGSSRRPARPRDPIGLEESFLRCLQGLLTAESHPALVAVPEAAAPYWDDEQEASVRDALSLASRRTPGAFRVLVVSPDRHAARRLFARLLAEAGQRLAVVPAGDARETPNDSEWSLRVLLRDARWFGWVALVEQTDGPLARLSRHRGPLVFWSASAWPTFARRFPDGVEVRIGPASPEVRQTYIAACLHDSPDAGNLARRVAGTFAVPLDVMEAAIAQARAMRADGPVSASVLDAAIREQLRTHLGDFAEAVAVGQGMEDLVLPAESLARLREMIAGYRHREKVLRDWGFAAKVGRGGGWTALFYGPPGTGKTMAAGIVARELGLEVYRVDLSRVVDKYIGETEKHLRRVFDEAERGQVMLLFDEADSLFGKRTSGAGSATDRYANMEVNYLLQRMERYEGVVVLTTNNERLLDEAFRRRLRYVVSFPMPDEAERERLWRGMIPAEAEVEGELDYGWLARQYEMSGGHIRNAVLRAAYQAAEEGGGLSQERLRQAADAEYRALGRVVREVVEDA